MRRAVLLPLAFAPPVAVALLPLTARNDDWNWLATYLLEPTTPIVACWLAFVAASVLQALLLRRTARGGELAPALLLGCGLLPFAVGAAAAVPAFHQGLLDFASVGAPATGAFALIIAAQVRLLGAALSTALLSMTAVAIALIALSLRARTPAPVRLAGLVCALPLTAVCFAVGSLDSSAPYLVPAAVALVALPLAASRRTPSLAVMAAMCLGTAVWTGTAVTSAALVECMFGLHGCGPSSRYQLAQFCATAMFPAPWLEDVPWGPGALSVLATGLAWARWQFHWRMARALVAGAALVASMFAMDAAAVTSLLDPVGDELGWAPVAAVPGFRPLAASYRDERAERASLALDRAGLRDTWKLLVPAAKLTPRALAPYLRAASHPLGAKQRPDETCAKVVVPRWLSLAVDARVTGAELRVLAAAAAQADIAIMYWLTSEAEQVREPDRRVSTWASPASLAYLRVRVGANLEDAALDHVSVGASGSVLVVRGDHPMTVSGASILDDQGNEVPQPWQGSELLCTKSFFIEPTDEATAASVAEALKLLRRNHHNGVLHP